VTISRVDDAVNGLRTLRQRINDGQGTVAQSLGGDPGTTFVNDASDFETHFGDLLTRLEGIQAKLCDTHTTYGNALSNMTDRMRSIRNQINL
jgi:hypothetical protein